MKYLVLISMIIFSLTAGASQYKKILLVVAMESEAAPIISEFKLKKKDNVFHGLPMQAYQGLYKHKMISLVVNGVDSITKVENIGTQAAVLSTYLGLQAFHPDLIISIGTAGGVAQNGSQLSEIYLSEKIYFYDRRINIPGYKEYGLGGYQSVSIPSSLKKVSVCSGDSFDENPTDYDNFIKQHCVAIDMEAAGVAWVAKITNTPMIAIKGITNYVRGDNIHEQYRKNIAPVTAKLTKELKKLLS